MTREATTFIETNRDKPFFLYFAPTLPHLALQVPERALAEYAGVLRVSLDGDGAQRAPRKLAPGAGPEQIDRELIRPALRIREADRHAEVA